MLNYGEQKLGIANPVHLDVQSKKGNLLGSIMSTPEQSKKATGPQMVAVASRFGNINVDKSKTILFPVGLLGMPEKHHFVITDFPNSRLKQFKLLQSMDDDELSFITLPIPLKNDIIDSSDIGSACTDLEIDMSDLTILLIVSVHRGVEGVQLSVNARAPLFIATEKQAAAQYVFTSNKYAVQHFITESKPAA